MCSGQHFKGERERNVHCRRKRKLIKAGGGNPAVSIRGGKSFRCPHRKDFHFPNQMGKHMPRLFYRTVRHSRRKTEIFRQMSGHFRDAAIQKGKTPQAVKQGFCTTAKQHAAPGIHNRH